MNSSPQLKSIQDCLSCFHKLNLLVFGDVILDVYLRGEVKRISPEAPVPILNTKEIDYRLGGGGNVACNLSNLGVGVTLASVIGKDKNGQHLLDHMKKANLPTQGMIETSKRKTSIKTRVIAQSQQIVRIDEEDTHVLEDEIIDEMIDRIEKNPTPIDGIIISDYGKGVVSRKSFEKLVAYARSRNIFTSLDPKQRNFPFYQDIDVMTPNHFEAAEDVGRSCESDDEVRSVGLEIMAKHRLRQLIITRGEKGMTLFDADDGSTKGGTKEKSSQKVTPRIHHIPTFNRSLFDVSGAGDTVNALYTAAYLSCRDSYLSALIANISAGIAVSHFGTYPITREDFNQELENSKWLERFVQEHYHG